MAEKLSSLTRRNTDRNYSLCLNEWKFVLKKVPGHDEFDYDILGYDFG